MNHIKVIRRCFYVVGILAVAFYFRYPISSVFIDTNIGGYKYIGLVVHGGQTNGFSYLLFDYPYFELAEENAKPWKECKRLNESLQSYLRNFVEGWKPSTVGYLFVSESSSQGYRAYIRFNDRVIFVRGFPDFGGSPPNEQEKKICEQAG